MQSRVRTLEESTGMSQQAAQQVMHAAEPSKLRSEPALSQQEVKHCKEQLGQREAALQAALEEAEQQRGAAEAAREQVRGAA